MHEASGSGHKVVAVQDTESENQKDGEAFREKGEVKSNPQVLLSAKKLMRLYDSLFRKLAEWGGLKQQ